MKKFLVLLLFCTTLINSSEYKKPTMNILKLQSSKVLTNFEGKPIELFNTFNLRPLEPFNIFKLIQSAELELQQISHSSFIVLL